MSFTLAKIFSRGWRRTASAMLSVLFSIIISVGGIALSIYALMEHRITIREDGGGFFGGPDTGIYTYPPIYVIAVYVALLFAIVYIGFAVWKAARHEATIDKEEREKDSKIRKLKQIDELKRLGVFLDDTLKIVEARRTEPGGPS